MVSEQDHTTIYCHNIADALLKSLMMVEPQIQDIDQDGHRSGFGLQLREPVAQKVIQIIQNAFRDNPEYSRRYPHFQMGTVIDDNQTLVIRF